MPPKKPSPATKITPKTTTQKPGTGRGISGKKTSTTAVKPGAAGSKGNTTKKGSTSPKKTLVKGKENIAVSKV